MPRLPVLLAVGATLALGACTYVERQPAPQPVAVPVQPAPAAVVTPAPVVTVRPGD
jgi:hypothetical protein